MLQAARVKFQSQEINPGITPLPSDCRPLADVRKRKKSKKAEEINMKSNTN
jgi:hypothetical protein